MSSERNATVAVIGAGDYIGAAIVKKFAAEGFVVFAGRRDADKLAPLVAEVESRGGRIVGRALDARTDQVTAFLGDADPRAPLEARSSDFARSHRALREISARRTST
jgi:hypothetical protein